MRILGLKILKCYKERVWSCDKTKKQKKKVQNAKKKNVMEGFKEKNNKKDSDSSQVTKKTSFFRLVFGSGFCL